MRKELFATRQKRLLQLLQTKFDGSQTKLAEAIDRTSAYVSFLLADKELPHHKNLGETLARHIETAVGLPNGWLDGEQPPEAQSVQPTKEDRQPPLGFVLIKRKIVNLAAGKGKITFEEETAPPLAFRTEWLEKENLKAENLVFTYAKNDCRGSRIRKGDLLMLDLSQVVLRNSFTYALQLGDDLTVRKVTRKTMTILLQTGGEDDPEEEELSLEQAAELHVMGRVVWFSGTI